MAAIEPDQPARMASLEASLAALAARTLDLEARLERLERPQEQALAQPPELSAPEFLEEDPAPGASAGLLVSLGGRACLILGGAFLIRAGTDSGMLQPLAGVGLALLYCVVWAVLADRGGRKGQRLWAGLQILTATAIALPMLWETTFRFQYLPPAASALALLVMTLLFLWVARRQALVQVAWLVLLGSLLTGFTLMAATSAITGFCAYFILLGGASLLVSDAPGWQALRWPAALGADLAVLVMTLLLRSPGGSEALARDLRGPRALALAIALVVVYLGAILYRTLKRPKAVGGFEAFQTFAVMVIGYWGAIQVAHATGIGVTPLGLAALVLGLGCYACAFGFVTRQAEGSQDFRFLTWLALVLLLAGGILLLGGWALAGSGLLLGLASLVLGLRFRRSVLLAHAGLYLAVAAFASGLLGSAWDGWLAAAPGPQGATGLRMVTLAALLGGHLLSSRNSLEAAPLRLRLPFLGMGGLGVFAGGGILVAVLAPLVKADPGALAALRTLVLVGLALASAALGRWRPGSELPWLAYPLLGITAIKVLLEDFPHGRPATLFLALTLLGCGLLAVAKCSRPTPGEGGQDGK